MQHCRGGKKSKRFSPGGDFTDQIFIWELSGLDSAGVLRQGVIMYQCINVNNSSFTNNSLRIFILWFI